ARNPELCGSAFTCKPGPPPALASDLVPLRHMCFTRRRDRGRLPMRPCAKGLAVGAVALGLAVSAAAAESADEIGRFYHTHPITLTVGYSAGSGYDMVARTVARHLGRHLPGHPSIIVVDEPGAGSLVAANRLYNLAAPDGTQIAIFGRSIFTEPLMGNSQAKFDPSRFSW